MKKIYLALLVLGFTSFAVMAKNGNSQLTVAEKIEKKTQRAAKLKSNQAKTQKSIDDLNKIAADKLTAAQKTQLEELAQKLSSLKSKEAKVGNDLAELKKAETVKS